jgi:hypothetical protein
LRSAVVAWNSVISLVICNFFTKEVFGIEKYTGEKEECQNNNDKRTAGVSEHELGEEGMRKTALYFTCDMERNPYFIINTGFHNKMYRCRQLVKAMDTVPECFQYIPGPS